MIVEHAITLRQPWAQFMANGTKLFETRSRATHFRGWLAIHAAKGFPRWAMEQAQGKPPGGNDGGSGGAPPVTEHGGAMEGGGQTNPINKHTASLTGGTQGIGV